MSINANSPEYMSDQRGIRRVESINQGRLILQGLNAEVNCEIRNMSPGGARVRLDNMFPVKTAHKLYIEGTENSVAVETVWQRGCEVGLKLKEWPGCFIFK